MAKKSKSTLPSKSSANTAPASSNQSSSGGGGGGDIANEATAAASNAGNAILQWLEQLMESAKKDNGFTLALYGAAAAVVFHHLRKNL